MSPSPFRRPSRRRFLQGASAGAAALAAARSLAGPTLLPGRAVAAPDDPEVLKVGLIGCGGRGTGAALQALDAEDRGTVRLVAVADVFPDKIENCLTWLQSTLGPERAHLAEVPVERRHVGLGAADRLIASDVDVVLLATPPYFRPAHLAACVDAGKHVFTEKPMAVDAPGVRSVLATAERARAAKLALVSGFCWRFNVRHREFYARLDGGALGPLRAVYSTYNASPLGTHPRQPGWTDTEWQLRNWQHFTWLSGDHVVEQAVHSLDKQAWALGDRPPLSAVAVGGRQAREGAERGNVYDHFSVTFDYADDVKAFHMCRQMANCSYDNSDWIWGERGRAEITRGGGRHVIDGPGAWEYEGPGNDMYQAEHDELFASIRKGQPRNDGVWMTRSTMLAIMARMCAYTGQTLTWDQALASEEVLGPDGLRFGDLDFAPVPIPGRTRFT